MSSPRIWFITGSSSGFGRYLTELVLAKGDIAIATLRKPEVLDALVKRYPTNQLLVLKLDVTKPDEIRQAFAKAEAQYGRIDVVFNNAAYALFGEVEASKDHAARAMFEVNFWGAVNVSRESIRFFREVNLPAGGRLLQMSSIAGIQGHASLGFYQASKFALEGLSEALANEVDPAWNIKVTLIEPGGFRTSGTQNMIEMPQHPAYGNPDIAAFKVRQYLSNNPYLPGDPAKAVNTIYRLSMLPDPPLHIPLGKDSVAVIKDKCSTLLADVEKFESWSDGLDADA